MLHSAALQGGVEDKGKKRYEMLDTCDNTAVIFMTSGLVVLPAGYIPAFKSMDTLPM